MTTTLLAGGRGSTVTTDPGQMWDERFSASEWPTDPDPLLTSLAAGLSPGRALDIGSGPGRNSLWLATRGWKVTAVDASAVALRQAVERATALGVTLTTEKTEVRDWKPQRSSADLVVIANLHLAPAELRSLLARVVEALRPRGHLFVVGHHISSLGHRGPSDPERLLTTERLARALPPGLDVERLTTTSRRTGRIGPSEPEDANVVLWATRSRTDNVLPMNGLLRLTEAGQASGSAP